MKPDNSQKNTEVSVFWPSENVSSRTRIFCRSYSYFQQCR